MEKAEILSRMEPLIHSPFTLDTVHEPAQRAILLQFILKELFDAKDFLKELVSLPLYPFDWGKEKGSLHKMQEYGRLLVCAFPELSDATQTFVNNLKRPCAELLFLLEPFLICCKDNPHLLYFLLQHQKELEPLSIFKKLHPQGIEKIKAIVNSCYRKKGISLPVWMN